MGDHGREDDDTDPPATRYRRKSARTGQRCRQHRNLAVSMPMLNENSDTRR